MRRPVDNNSPVRRLWQKLQKKSKESLRSLSLRMRMQLAFRCLETLPADRPSLALRRGRECNVTARVLLRSANDQRRGARSRSRQDRHLSGGIRRTRCQAYGGHEAGQSRNYTGCGWDEFVFRSARIMRKRCLHQPREIVESEEPGSGRPITRFRLSYFQGRFGAIRSSLTGTCTAVSEGVPPGPL